MTAPVPVGNLAQTVGGRAAASREISTSIRSIDGDHAMSPQRTDTDWSGQVRRKLAYDAAHPDTAITPPGPDTCLWLARQGGKILAAGYRLGALMDDLEWLEAGRKNSGVSGSLETEADARALPAVQAIGEHTATLAHALTLWSVRDDTKAEPEVRRAASTAVDMLDAMLAELHQLRARLVAEIRASDAAAAERADQLLARAIREQSSSGPTAPN
jgi:hypothetical protein